MPRVKAYRSNQLVNVNVSRYRVKWDGKCLSKFQASVKKWLKPYWDSHIVVEEWPLPGTRLRCDLVNLTKKIIVETSGKQHVEFNAHFHNKNRFQFRAQIARDEAKREWAADNGFIFVEIYDEDMPLTEDFFKREYDIDI